MFHPSYIYNDKGNILTLYHLKSDQWPIPEIQHPLQPAELASSPFGPREWWIFLFQEAFSAGSVGCWMCQRVLNFPHPLFISQSQGCLQKVLVRGWGMFVKQFSSLLCRRVLKMHKGAEFSTSRVPLQRVLNFFLKRATDVNPSFDHFWPIKCYQTNRHLFTENKMK